MGTGLSSSNRAEKETDATVGNNGMNGGLLLSFHDALLSSLFFHRRHTSMVSSPNRRVRVESYEDATDNSMTVPYLECNGFVGAPSMCQCHHTSRCRLILGEGKDQLGFGIDR
jgi:hypothetical protein